MKKMFAMVLTGIIVLSLSSCRENLQVQALKKENEELRQRLESYQLPDSSDYSTAAEAKVSQKPSQDNLAIEAKWYSDGGEGVFEDNEKRIEILEEIGVTKDSNGDYALILSFNFTNKLDEGNTFANNAVVTLYQDGIELPDAGYINDEKIYTSQDFTKIKHNATIKVQQAYKLLNTISPIEVEIETGGQRLKKQIELTNKD